eukprot:SAG11_NODE_25740_length_354_cov_1.615686_1_plen_93_part_10
MTELDQMRVQAIAAATEVEQRHVIAQARVASLREAETEIAAGAKLAARLQGELISLREVVADRDRAIEDCANALEAEKRRRAAAESTGEEAMS